MTEAAIDPKSPAWAREPVQRLLSNVRQIHEFYYLTIAGLRMIIHHHEFLVRGDERIKQLTAEVEINGGTADRNEAEEAKREEGRRQATERPGLALREVF